MYISKYPIDIHFLRLLIIEKMDVCFNQLNITGIVSNMNEKCY